MRNAVAAFWPSLESPDWAKLVDPGSSPAVGVVVADSSIPATVAGNSDELHKAQDSFAHIPGVLLGYVFSRTGRGDYDNLRSPGDVLIDVNAWYANLGDHLDGIYFDNAVMPGDALDQQRYPTDTGTQTAQQYWTSLLPQVRAAHPAARTQPPPGSPVLPHSQMMLLAGASPNKWLLELADYLLLWETDSTAYLQHFAAYAQLQDPPPPATKSSYVAYPPRWWRDPSNSDKIIHTVNRVVEYEQRVTYLAFTERNAGQLWQTNDYAQLPTYWQTEGQEAAFLTNNPSAALSDWQVLRAANRIGAARQALTAWPNFEAAWYEEGQVRGTIFLASDLAGVSVHDVPVAELEQAAWGDLCGDPVTPFDVAGMWSAAHTWARSHGFETAIPTFGAGQAANGLVYGVIAFDAGLPWLRSDSMPVTEADDQPPPGFTDAGGVVRNVARWASTTGVTHWGRPVLTGWPSFEVPLQPEPVTGAMLPADPQGRVHDSFAVYMVDAAQPGIHWEDVTALEYYAML